MFGENFVKTLTNGLLTKMKSTHSDWSVNDPSEEGYIKNRPFYSIDKVISEPLNITWDGDTTGKVSIEDMLFKISDLVLTDEQIKLTTVTLSTGESYKISDIWDLMVDNGLVTDDMVFGSELGFAFVRKTGAIFEGITFPEVGIYAIKYNTIYVQSITTTESVEYVKSVIKKIDQKFLPNMSPKDKITTGKFTVSNGSNNSVIVTTNDGATYIHSSDGSVLCIGEDYYGSYITDLTGQSVYRFVAPTSIEVPSNAHDHNYGLEIAEYPNALVISGYAFQDTAIKKADFPQTTSIGSYSFRDCYNLVDVNIPKVTQISNYCFRNCSALSIIDLPLVTSIFSYAFYSCSALNTVILRSKVLCTLQKTNAFISTPIANGTGYIYVPKALVDSYKSATNWSTYAARFRAIEDYPEICGGGTGAPEEWVFELEDGTTVTKQVVVQ